MGMKKFFYRVQKGDSVLSISNRFKVSAIGIISENNLKREVSAGDLLLICQDSCVHVVQPFESVSEVASKYGLSQEKLLSQNEVDYLFYGLILRI